VDTNTNKFINLPLVCLEIKSVKNRKCLVQNVKKYERKPISKISIGIYASINSDPAIRTIKFLPKIK
tara:strand:- start:13 stop:213 length:201 start_codon:yes stop_codon:yes gene_type:complete